MWGAIKKAINSNLSKSLDVLIQEKTTETNSKVDSVDSKVQTGNNLIGATNNTGGTTTSGSIFAKLNKLLTDWTTTRAGYLDNINANVGTLLNGRVVKSVQRGVIEDVTGSAYEYIDLTVAFNYINPLKSIVLLDSWYENGVNREPYIKQLNTNNMIIKFPGAPSNKCNFSWQVIEFY